METLEERLAVLEDRVTELEKLIARNMSAEGVLEFQKLRIVGEDGRFLAMVGLDKDGKARIRFYDEEGHTRLIFGVDDQGPGLAFMDGNGTIRIVLALTDQGPKVGMMREDGEPLMTMNVQGVESVLACHDPIGKLEIRGSMVWLRNLLGKGQMILTSKTKAGPRMTILNNEGEKVFETPGSKQA